MRIIEYLSHSFIADFLDDNSIVIDLGGNRGEFAKFIFENFNSTIYVVEPILELYNQILENSKIKKFNYCISNQKEIEVSIPESQCATIYDKNFKNKIICKGITLKELINQNNISKIDLLKVDIEGAEIEMFETIPNYILKNINQITIEFHDFLWPELRFKVEKIKEMIKDNGFYCIKFSIKNNGDVLFVKKDLIPKIYYFYLKYFYRYILGIKRILSRSSKRLWRIKN
ncbi:MAG: FkbM family methyltransferase [Patescibacteria group bacterium]|nr:FkbM family methyltransferase [Patescibacteria group bacterium]